MNKLTRRGLVATVGAAGAGVCLCGLARNTATFTKKGKTPALAPGQFAVAERAVAVALDRVPALRAVGGAVKIIDPGLPEPIIIARTGADEFAAVALRCPHRGVEVEYRPEARDFRCASLGHSRFAADGQRLRGPARRGLARYAARIDPADANRLLVAL